MNTDKKPQKYFLEEEQIKDQLDNTEELFESKDIEEKDTEKSKIEDLQKESQDYKDQLLRTLAEIENLRKRSQREKEETRQYALTGFARDLLSVADNFQRAFSILDSNLATLSPEIQNFIEGLRLTEKEFNSVLSKNGIQKVSPLGEKFDHNFHQAIFEGESTEYDAGIVMQVLQEGYTLNNRLLRPAMVGVVK